jgi:multicomponent Na+:H+ antiporter subunit C
VSILLAATAAFLFGIGTYIVMQRKLSRIIIGLALISHGANVLLMTSGRRGTAPIIGNGDPADFSDPLPQALALTAIVITFAVTAFLLAMAYRSWLLTADDEVQDDLGDRLIAARTYIDADEDDMADEVAEASMADEVAGDEETADEDTADDAAGARP